MSNSRHKNLKSISVWFGARGKFCSRKMLIDLCVLPLKFHVPYAQCARTPIPFHNHVIIIRACIVSNEMSSTQVWVVWTGECRVRILDEPYNPHAYYYFRQLCIFRKNDGTAKIRVVREIQKLTRNFRTKQLKECIEKSMPQALLIWIISSKQSGLPRINRFQNSNRLWFGFQNKCCSKQCLCRDP